MSAKRPGPQPAFVISVEGYAHVLHVDQRLPGRLTHDLYRILVAQEVAALYRVIGMVFPLVPPVCEGGIDAPLGSVGVAPYRVDFADDCRVGAADLGSDSSPHSG